MNEELQRLYEIMQAQGLLPAEVRYDAFAAKMGQEGELRKLYDGLAANKAVKGTWEQFSAKIESGKKKAPAVLEPVSPDGSGAPLFQDTTPAPAAASAAPSDVAPWDATMAQMQAPPTAAPQPQEPFQEPSPASLLTSPTVRESTAQPAPAPPQQIDISKYSLTGDEDPLQVAEDMRKVEQGDNYDYRKTYDSKTVLRQANRDMAGIAEFGTLARKQTLFADDQLKQKYGEDWAQQLENMSNYLESNKELSASNDWQTVAATYNSIIKDPLFQTYTGGVKAQNKAFENFTSYATSHPEYKKKVEEALASQRQQNLGGLSGAPEMFSMPMFGSAGGAGWAFRKGAQLLGGLATLPRTVSGALPESMVSKKWGAVDEFYSMMDEVVQSANINYPKPEQYARPLYERIVPFEGKQVVVDAKGKPIEVRDKNGNVIVPPAPAEGEKSFEQRLNEANLPVPTPQFNGSVASTLDKTLDVAADLMIYRFMAGGSKPGVVLSSMAMQHQDLYNEAIREQKMTPQDAAEYAFYSALGNGVIEAYVGDIETKALLRPTIKEAVQLGKKEALAAAGKLTAPQRAMIRFKPLIKDVVGENTEEFLQSLQGDMTRTAYNTATGAQMELQTTPDQLKEQALLTTLVTTPFAALGMGGYANQYRMSASLAAAKNPEQFKRLLTDMVLNNKITQEEAQQKFEWAKRMNAYNATLPPTLSDNDRAHVLALQDYRNEAQKIADDEDRVDALRQEARQEVKNADEIIGSIVKKATPAQDATNAEIPETPVPVVENSVEKNAPKPAKSYDSEVLQEFAAMGTPEGLVATEKEMSAQLLPQVNITAQENYTPAVSEEQVAALPEASQNLAAGTFFSEPTATVGQLAESVAQPQGEATPEQIDVAAETQAAVGDRITEAALDMLKRKGYEVGAKEVAKIRDFVLPEFLQKPFINNPDEHPAVALNRITDEYMMEQGKIPVPAQASVEMANAVNEVNSTMSSLSPAEQQAVDNFVADLQGDANRIGAAINGDGNQSDIQQFTELSTSFPKAADVLQKIAYASKSNISGTLVAPVGQAGAVTEQTPAAPAQETPQELAGAQANQTQGGNVTEGIQPSDSVTKTVQLAAQPITSAKDAEQVNRQADEIIAEAELPEEISPAAEQTLRDEGIVQDGESVNDAVARIMDENTEEQVDAVEAKDYTDMVNAREGATVLDRPVFVETDTEFIVKDAGGQEDVMRELGAMPSPRGWVFPIEAKEMVMASLRPLNPSPSDMAQMANNETHSGRNGVAMRDKKVYAMFSQRKERIAKGKTLAERIQIAKEELNHKEDARPARVRLVAERLQKAFPGIEVIMDAAEVESAAKKAFPDAANAPVGFVHEGKVYIDVERAGIDTPIHEFGHIWNTLAALHDPAFHQQGLEAVAGTEYEAAVREDPRYAHLDDAGVLDEALALAIGERGARIMNLTNWQRFSQWLNDLFSVLRAAFKGNTYHQLTAAEYADLVAAKLLSGKELMFETSEDVARIEKQAKAMFVGEQAEMGEQAKQDLEAAKYFEANGWKNREVWMTTNWRRGVDGRWRFEIADDMARVTIEPRLVTPNTVMPLSEAMQHDELFAAYPYIRDLPVMFNQMPSDVNAALVMMDDGRRFIMLNSNKAPDIDHILHEVQHEIQLREGFSFPKPETASERMNKIQPLIDEVVKATGQEEIDARRVLDDAIEKYNKAYMNQAGEVEARNTVTRRFMPSTVRAMSYPPSTEDVAQAEQIVFFPGELIGAEAKTPGYEQEGELMSDWTPQARAQYGDNRLREAATRSAAKQLVDIEVANASKMEDVVGPIAQGLGLDVADVETMWQDAERVRGRKVPVWDIHEGAIAKTVKSVKDYVAHGAKRNVAFGGLLPNPVYKAIKEMGNKIQGTLYAMQKANKDLEDAMRDHFAPYAINPQGKNIKIGGVTFKGLQLWRTGRVPQEFRRHVNKVLKGEAGWDTLPDSIRPHVQTMRNLIDDLSAEMLRAGVFPENMVVRIMENMGIEVGEKNDAGHYYVVAHALALPPHMRTKEENLLIDSFLETHKKKFGTYLNRSYRIHSIPEWAKEVQFNRPVWDAARRFYIDMYKEERARLEEKIAKKEAKAQEQMAQLDKELTDAQGTANSILKDIEARSEDAKAVLDKAQAELDGDAVAHAQDMLAMAEKEKDEAKQIQLVSAAVSGLTPETIAELDAIAGDDKSALSALARQIRDIKMRAWKLEREMAEDKEKLAKRLDSINGYLNNIDEKIREVLAGQKGNDSALKKGGIPGRKELGITKKLKDIPPEVRALFGEYDDSIVNFTNTVVKMARLLHTQQFLNEMRDKYAGIYFFEGGNRPAGNYEKIAAAGNQAFAPLDGWYTSPDIIQGLKDEFNPTVTSWWESVFVRHVINRVKLGKTVLNPQGIMRNFFGNPMLALANAWNPKAMYDIWNEVSAMRNDQDSSKWRAYSKRLYDLGVRGESTHAGDIKDLQETLGMRQNEPYDLWTDKLLWGLGETIRKAPGDIFKAASRAWELGDEFWKIMGFEAEKRQYAQAWFGKPFSELNAEQQDAVERRAAHIARSVVPTFSVVPRIVREIRRNPFMGTFPAFPAEMMRVTYNIPALAHEEMKDPRTKWIGMKRLAGYGSALSLINLILPAILRHVYGYSKEKWESLMEFVAPWMKNAELLPLGEPDKNNVVRFINPSYSDPFAWVSETWNAMTHDPDATLAQRAFNTFGAISDPFFSPELSANTIGHLLYNVDDKGNKLRLDVFKDETLNSPLFSEQNLRRQFSYARGKLQPGFVKSAWDAWDIAHINADKSGRVKEWSDFLISHAFGINIERVDPSVSYRFKMKDLVQQKNDARAVYTAKINQLQRSWDSLQPKLETMEPADRQARITRFSNDAFDDMTAQYNESKSAYYRVLEEAHKYTDKLHQLGFGYPEIREILKEQQFGTKNGEINAIVSGNYAPVVLKFDKKAKFPVSKKAEE